MYLLGRFCKKGIKRKCNNISSINDKEAEDRAEQNERKCEVYGSRICLFVCEIVCFVLFLFLFFNFVLLYFLF